MKALLKMIRTVEDANTLLEICNDRNYFVNHKKHSIKLNKEIILKGGFSTNFGGYGSYSALGLGANFDKKWEIVGDCKKSFSKLNVHIDKSVPVEIKGKIEKYIKKMEGEIVDIKDCNLVITENSKAKKLKNILVINSSELLKLFPAINPKPKNKSTKFPQELKEFLKKLQSRDLDEINKTLKLLETNQEYIDILLGSVAVIEETGELERGSKFKGTKPALQYQDIALLKLLSISSDNSKGKDLRNKIKKLDISVIEIPTIKGFDQLEELSLVLTDQRGCSTKNLKNLGKFKKLKKLRICLDNFSNFEIRSSWYDGDKILDIESLDGLDAPTLEDLEIKNVGLSNISALKNCPNIKNLNLSENIELIDVDSLSSCTNLETLNLSKTSIKSLKALSENISLNSINLDECKCLKTLEGIEKLKLDHLGDNNSYSELNLITLDGLESLESIKYFPLIEKERIELRLTRLNIKSLDGIKNCKNIECLNLSQLEELVDIDSIITLEKLSSIRIDYLGKLLNLQSLGKLKSLKQFYIDTSSKIEFNQVFPEIWPASLKELDIERSSAEELGQLPENFERLSIKSCLNLKSLKGLASCKRFNMPYDDGSSDTLDLSSCVSLENLDGLENKKQLKTISISPYIKNLDAINANQNLKIVIKFENYNTNYHGDSFKKLGLKEITNMIPKVLTESLSKLQPFNLEVETYGDNVLADINGLSSLNNIKSLDLGEAHVKDVKAISTMENIEYVRLNNQTEITKILKARVFETEGQIAKLKIKLLASI